MSDEHDQGPEGGDEAGAPEEFGLETTERAHCYD